MAAPIARNLAAVRRDVLKVTQEKLAEELGISARTISRYENGRATGWYQTMLRAFSRTWEGNEG